MLSELAAKLPRRNPKLVPNTAIDGRPAFAHPVEEHFETKSRWVPFEEESSTRVRSYEEQYQVLKQKTQVVEIDFGLDITQVEKVKELVLDLGTAIQVAIDEADSKGHEPDPTMEKLIGNIKRIVLAALSPPAQGGRAAATDMPPERDDMTSPIALSLAGRGRVVLLEPKTVRQAYFRFQAANQLTARQVHRFDLPRPARQAVHLDRAGSTSAACAVFRPRGRYVPGASGDRPDRAGNEWHAVGRGCGVGPRRRHCQPRIRSQFGRPRQHAQGPLRGPLRFDFRDRTAHAQRCFADRPGTWSSRGMIGGCASCVTKDLRPHGQQTGVEVRFRDRFDLSRAWSVSLSDFAPRRLFAIGNVATFDGFHIREW